MKPCISLLCIILVSYHLGISQAGQSKRKCAPYEPTVPRSLAANDLPSFEKECRENAKRSRSTLNVKTNISTVEDIKSNGYVVSTQTMLSEDGYYTTAFRISGGELSPPKQGKQPVLLFHGISCSGKSWTIQPKKRNLAYILADAGYDVWLYNARGSAPSINHTHLNAKKDVSYWNFTFDEMGTLDLPLVVDRMLNETGNEKVFLVCHSAGCASFLVGLAELPELNKKFKAGFLLAPATFLGSTYSPLVKLAPIIGTRMENILNIMLKGRMTSEPSLLSKSIGIQGLDGICLWSSIKCGLCDKVIFAMHGADPEQLNFTGIPNIIAKGSDNLGWKNLVHLGQNILGCDFQKYDYGTKKNLQVYGSPEPPKYNVEKIEVPVYIFYGESDAFSTPWDAQRTRDAIPSKYMKGCYRVDWPQFNHIDFMIANDADKLLYNKILSIMKKLDAEDV